MKKGKQKIIEAAFEVILQKGIKDTSVRDIAKEAGISVGTFSYHYPNKETLFYDVFEMMIAKQDEVLEKGFSSNTLEEKKVALAQLFKMTATNDCYMKLNYYLLGEAFGQNTMLLEKMKQKYEDWRQQFSAYLDAEIKKQDKQLSAALFLAMIDGVMLQLLLDAKSIDVDEVANEIIRLLYE